MHLLALLLTIPVIADDPVTVDPSIQYQEWDGWGTSLAWWAVVVGDWSDDNRSAIADLLFDRDTGLGLNIVRYQIGSSDDPAHDHMRVGGNIQSFWPGEGESYDWSVDAGQRRMLDEALRRGVNITEAYSCSPPYWMTVSGCSSGAPEASDDNLRDEHYETFADYLTEVARHFHDEWGITFTTLAPMNEPVAHYWSAEKFQQGCHFERESQNRLLRLVAGKLSEKDLPTQLSAGDETCTEHCVQSFHSYDPDVQAAIAQINTHTYNYSWDRFGPRYLADRFGKRLHMSEICFASRAPDEDKQHDHESIVGVLDLARAITRDLREMRPDAWVLWQSLTHELYSTWWNFNYGLIHADYASEDETFEIMRKYYGYAQYARFIRPGARMIDISAPDAVCFRDGERLIIVAYNDSDALRERAYDLSSFDRLAKRAKPHRTSESEKLAALDPISIRGKQLHAIEPAGSVTTYVIDAARYRGPESPKPIWINDTEFEYAGDWDYTDNAPGAFVTDNHWSPEPDAAYTIRFPGTQLRLYCATAPNLGIAAISVDNGPETLVDLYAEKRVDQSLIFTTPILPLGNHLVTVRVTGDKNEASSHTHIAADRADVVR